MHSSSLYSIYIECCTWLLEESRCFMNILGAEIKKQTENALASYSLHFG